MMYTYILMSSFDIRCIQQILVTCLSLQMLQQCFFNMALKEVEAHSAINFVFPSVPLQLDTRKLNAIPNICKLGDANRVGRRDKCDARDQLVTPDCLCTHVVNIEQGQTYQFVEYSLLLDQLVQTGILHTQSIFMGTAFMFPKSALGHTVTQLLEYRVQKKISSVNTILLKMNTFVLILSGLVRMLRRLEMIIWSTYTPRKDTVLVPAGG